jgi:hypothetical protein
MKKNRLTTPDKKRILYFDISTMEHDHIAYNYHMGEKPVEIIIGGRIGVWLSKSLSWFRKMKK